MKMPYLNRRLSLLKLNLLRLILPPIHEKRSCITPNGHITEQYILPNNNVRSSKITTITMLTARIAGTNCILAIHENHL